MKGFISISLALIFVFQPFAKLYVWVSFELNREYFAQVLCVKRTIKNNTCQGTCQLNKKLQALENDKSDEPSETSSISYKIIDLLFWVDCPCLSLKPFVVLTINTDFFYRSIALQTYKGDIFAPPRLASSY